MDNFFNRNVEAEQNAYIQPVQNTNIGNVMQIMIVNAIPTKKGGCLINYLILNENGTIDFTEKFKGLNIKQCFLDDQVLYGKINRVEMILSPIKVSYVWEEKFNSASRKILDILN